MPRREELKPASAARSLGSSVLLLLVVVLAASLAACSKHESEPVDSVGDQAKTPVAARPLPRALDSRQVAGFRARAESALSRLGRGVEASLLVVDLDTGETLFERNPDQALVPASNMKVLTGGIFLAAFGAEHKLSTRFLADGPIDENGRLDGDLIVVGGGDPSLSGRLFGDDPARAIDAVAGSLETRGLRSVTGRILADGRLFQGPSTGEAWPKDGPWNRYMAEVSALILNDNRTLLECRVEGNRAQVQANPQVGFISIENRLALGTEQNIVVSRGRDDNRFVVSGRIVANSLYDADVSIHDGDLFYVSALAVALETRGIEVAGVGRVAADRVLPEDATLLNFTSSARRSLGTMLSESQNLYAEAFFRLIGVELEGEGSFAGGSRAVTRWLEQRGILMPDTRIADGSGLSRANRSSARQIIAVLDVLHRDQAAEAFLSALAQPGEEGTLEKRLPSLAGRLQGKTGTLSNVSALSGYLELGDGRRAAFSMIFNDCIVSRARAIQDEICGALGELRP